MGLAVRDKGRLALALMFALVFIVTVLASLVVAATGTREARDSMNSLLQVLLPAEMALLGAATAWYFAGG